VGARRSPGRRLLGGEKGVERLLGLGLSHRLLVKDLGLGLAGDALDRRVRLGALEVLQELERLGVADLAEREDGRAARGVVEVAAGELLDRFGGARVADLAERGERRCFTSSSVPRRKSCWMSTGVASVARRLPHASIALALTRMSGSPIAWTRNSTALGSADSLIDLTPLSRSDGSSLFIWRANSSMLPPLVCRS
jgi:hypothetical protein